MSLVTGLGPPNVFQWTLSTQANNPTIQDATTVDGAQISVLAPGATQAVTWTAAIVASTAPTGTQGLSTVTIQHAWDPSDATVPGTYTLVAELSVPGYAFAILSEPLQVPIRSPFGQPFGP